MTETPTIPTPPAGGWPRISIVIPSFQQGSYLEETLDSILAQGYPELELLVMDGGSTDSTVEILRRRDADIDVWVSEPDRGQSHAINKGFARATGEILTFFGSDDLYLPGAFFAAARRLSEHPEAGAAVGAFRVLGPGSAPAAAPVLPRMPGEGPLHGPRDLALTAPQAWRLHQVATFFRTRALDAVGRHVREELRYTMDRELLYRLARAYPVVLAEEPWAAFRRHPESKSGNAAVGLAFCREMGSLHHLDAPAEESSAAVRRRRRYERHWRAKGHLRRAASDAALAVRASSLMKAAALEPPLLLRKSYWVRWLDLAGLGAPLRRALGREETLLGLI